MKSLLKKILPDLWTTAYRQVMRNRQRSRDSRRDTSEVFSDIYRNNVWGGTSGELCSGTGSSEGLSGAYVDFAADFLYSHGIKHLVDLGCGDFTVSRRLLDRLDEDVQYVGVDIVPFVIETHQQTHASDRIAFACADICTDPLPDGEICLIRQVMQHLSNAQVSQILQNTKKYPMVLVTEHFPPPDQFKAPNLDKPHGSDTRILDGSAVCLDQPPFNVPRIEQVHQSQLDGPQFDEGESLRTYLIRNG